jgi:hypothetical protein
MKNHLGSYECKLCLTLHNNEGNYLAHTQGKRHQTNLARRAAREAMDAQPQQPGFNSSSSSSAKRVMPRKRVKIGRPGYTVIKQKDPETGLKSLRFEVCCIVYNSSQLKSTQLTSTQLNSTQLNSTQLNSTQLNSTQLNSTVSMLMWWCSGGGGCWFAVDPLPRD